MSLGDRATFVDFSSEATRCTGRRVARLRLTCTIAIRGDRNDRFGTIVVPIMGMVPRLYCEGLLCATMAETGRLVVVINAGSRIVGVTTGSGGAHHCSTLGGLLLGSTTPTVLNAANVWGD